MANVTYDLLWRETMRDLLDMLELDPPQDQDEEESFQHFSYLYIKYVQIYKNLEDCYDQHVHPQKRNDIKDVLEAVIGRMLEIKEHLVNLKGFKFINFDDILVDLKLIPETLELPVPRYFVDERQKDLMLREKLVKTFIAARDADKDESAADGENQGLSTEDAIRLIQINERGRQGKQRARFMKEIRKQEELEKKLKELGSTETDPDSAATVIQKLFRGFKTMKQARMMREEELVFIGMKQPEPKPRELDPVCRQTDIRSRRKIIQAQNKDEYEEALVNIRRKIYDDEGVDMREQMMDMVRQWFVNWHEQNGSFPEYPEDPDVPGGSMTIFEPPDMVEAPEEEEEGDGKKKDDKKGGDKKKDDKKKDDKKKGKDEEEDDDTPAELPPSQFVLKMQACTEKFCQVWQDRDETHNFPQKYDAELIREALRPGVRDEIRLKEVDTVMKEELENLRLAVEKGKKGKKKKGKKKGKGKGKGKKGKKDKIKDLTPDRTMDSLIKDLVDKDILQLPAQVGVRDYVGHYKNLDAVEQKAMDPQVPEPSMAQIRQTVIEQLILPLGSLTAHQQAPYVNKALLYGPKGTGKTLVVEAICRETGANLINLSARNLDPGGPGSGRVKYPDKKGAQSAVMMINICFKVARALAPTVMLFDDIEWTFLTDKKKVKAQWPGEKPPSRFVKDFLKEAKKINKNDRILILGTSNRPFLLEKGDLKKFNAFFSNGKAPKKGDEEDKARALKLFLPLPDYASLQLLWKTLIVRHGGIVTDALDIQTLSWVAKSAGYSAGAINQVVSKVLTERRITRLAAKPLTGAEFIPPLSKIDPVFKEEYEQFAAWTQKNNPQGKPEEKPKKDDGKGKGKKDDGKKKKK